MAFIGNIDGVLGSSCGKVFNDLSETSKISDRLFGGELGAPKNNKKAEIDTVMQMMTDGKSIAETKAMLQEMTYWKWELAEEPQFGDSDDNIKPRRLRIRDNTAKRHEEKAIRESFQSLVNTAKIVGEGAIHGIIMTANKLNAKHGYRYPSYIAELDEVLRMKTTPQIYIENNFEQGSCTFNQGSSLNGDILSNQQQTIMSEITNNFEKDSCRFEAGSSLNGNVTINAPIYQGTAKPEEKTSDGSCSIGSPLHLSSDKGTKIDLIRIMNAWFECGKVVDANGKKPNKKEFFTWVGKLFNIDLADYDKDLSNSMATGVKYETQTRIFEELKNKHEQIYNSK